MGAESMIGEAAMTGGFPWASVASAVLPSLLGGFGASSNKSAYDAQLQAQREQAARYEAMGAPYRQRLSDLYSDPTAFLSSPEVQQPLQQGTNMLARSLSTQGNPIGSGNALQSLQDYTGNQLFERLGQEKDRLAGFGGLSQYQSAAPSIGTSSTQMNPYTADIWNAAGYGAGKLNDIFNPPKESALDTYLRSITK